MSTDRLHGMCGHNGGTPQDCMERGWGPLLCWPSSHIAITLGRLSLGACESSHSMMGLGGPAPWTLCLCPREPDPSTLDHPVGCLGNRGAAGLTKSTAVPCTDFFTDSRHHEWDGCGQKGPFLLSLASSSPRPEPLPKSIPNLQGSKWEGSHTAP